MATAKCVGLTTHRGGLGHILHHVVAQAVALQTADSGLHLRVAFDVFDFFLDVLLAHAQVLGVAAHLANHVHAAEYQEHSRSLPEKLHQRSAEEAPADAHALERQRQERLQLVARDGVYRPQKDRQQDDAIAAESADSGGAVP